MTDRAKLAIKDDGTTTLAFVILITADKDEKNPSGIPSHDGQNGPWRQELTDGRFVSKFNRDHTQCTANDANAAVIWKRWGPVLTFLDDYAEAVFLKYMVTSQLRGRVTEIHADWKTQHVAPPEASELILHPELPLKPYQQVPAVCSQLLPGYALLMEQGTGKTPVVVNRVCNSAAKLRASGETRMYRTIIVCPKNVRANWVREFKRFSTCKGKVTVMRRGHIGRIRELATAMGQYDDEHYTVLIISFGLLVNAFDNLLGHIDWDLAVVDEMHGIKWHETDRTKYCHKLRDKSQARMGLTGTPIVNSALDLYSQLEFLEQGLSGCANFKSFRDKYGSFVKGNNGRDVMTHVQNVPALKARLAEVAFIVRKDEVLKDLPDKVYDIIEVEMTKKQQDTYDALASEMIIEIEEELRDAEEEGGGKREMVINNALVKLMKLAQITSGFLNVPEERDEEGNVVIEATQIQFNPNPKLDELESLLKEHIANNPLEKVLVWTCYKYDVMTICNRLSQAGIKHVRYEGSTSDNDRVLAEKLYNEDPTVQVWVGNAAAGGVGLNLLGYVPGLNEHLNTNTSWNIYYSQSHKPVDRWQSEDRGHRTGTRVTVRVTDLVVPETMDEDIRVKVLDKKKHALDMQDLREIMNNIVKRRGERR